MSVYSKNEIEQNFIFLISYLRNCIDSRKFLFLEKDKILLKTSFQGIFNLKFENNIQKILHQLIIETCVKAEKISPGSFDETLQKILDDKHSYLEHVASYCPTLDNVSSLLDSHFQDDLVLKSSVLEAISIAGFGGRISVEKSSNETISVEEINGFAFKVKNTFETKSVRISNPKIICIDGFVESVSELNRLFEEAAETKTQIILVTRGFHDDVLNTIKINKHRGSMFIYPVLVDFDISGINKINDISIVSGQLPISSNLGHLISNVSLKDASKIEEITLNKDSITIKNSFISAEISRHISFLLQQREIKIGAEEIFDERIKSLSNKNVIIRIPNSPEFTTNNQKIDLVLRSIKSMLDLGVTDSGELSSTKIISDKFSKDFESLLNCLGTMIL